MGASQNGVTTDVGERHLVLANGPAQREVMTEGGNLGKGQILVLILVAAVVDEAENPPHRLSVEKERDGVSGKFTDSQRCRRERRVG